MSSSNSIRLGSKRTPQTHNTKALPQAKESNEKALHSIIGQQRRRNKPASISQVRSDVDPFQKLRTERNHADSGLPEKYVVESRSSTEEAAPNTDFISKPGKEYWGDAYESTNFSASDSSKESAREAGGVPTERASGSETTKPPEPEFADDDNGIEREKPQSNELSSATHSSFDSNAESNEGPTDPPLSLSTGLPAASTTLSHGTEQAADLTILTQTPPRTLGVSVSSLRRARYTSSKPQERKAKLQLKEKPLDSAGSSSSEETNTSTPTRKSKFANLFLTELTQKRARTTSTKPRPKMHSPRNAVKDFRFGKPAKVAETIIEIEPRASIKPKKTKLKAILNNLPSGIILDIDGNLSGGSLITNLPKTYREGTINVQPKKEGMAYQDFVNERYAEALAGKITQLDGHSFVAQAASDFFRTDIEFINNQGVFRSADIESTDSKVRNKIVAQNLFDFAGTENAAFVLSSMLQQGLVTGLLTSLANSEGEALSSHLRPINNKTTINGRKIYLFMADGSRQEIIDKRGMGTAKFQVSRNENNDFRIKLDWQAYYDLQRKAGDGGDRDFAVDLPLGRDDVIGVHYQTEYIINSTKADKGEIDISTEGIRAEFSGRLQMK